MSIFNCNITFKMVEGDSLASTHNKFIAHSLVDENWNILSLNKTRIAIQELNEEAKEVLGVGVQMFEEDGIKLFPNVDEFDRIDGLKKIQSNLTPEQTQQIKELKQSDSRWNKYSDEDIQRFIDSKTKESNVKDVVYHGSPEKIKGNLLPSEKGTFGKGVYFTKNFKGAKDFSYTIEQLDEFGFPKLEEENKPKGSVVQAIINTKNPQKISVYSSEYEQLESNGKVFSVKNINKEITGDSIIGDRKLNTTTGLEYIVFEPSQIYILNSDKAISDMEKFFGKEDQLPDCI